MQIEAYSINTTVFCLNWYMAMYAYVRQIDIHYLYTIIHLKATGFLYILIFIRQIDIHYLYTIIHLKATELYIWSVPFR